MLFRLFTAVLLALAFGMTAAGQPPPRFTIHKFGYKCYGGRFIVREGGRTHYCYDQTHYMEEKGKPSTVPASVKSFLLQQEAAAAERDAAWRAKWDEFERGRQGLREQHEANKRARGRGLYPPPSSLRQTESRVEAFTAAPTLDAASADPSPERTVPLTAFSEVTAGQSRKDVVAKLGQPLSRMSGLANRGERWSYRLDTGAMAKVTFEDGIVTGVVLPH